MDNNGIHLYSVNENVTNVGLFSDEPLTITSVGLFSDEQLKITSLH